MKGTWALWTGPPWFSAPKLGRRAGGMGEQDATGGAVMGGLAPGAAILQ